MVNPGRKINPGTGKWKQEYGARGLRRRKRKKRGIPEWNTKKWRQLHNNNGVTETG
jgi:hypothetical protein